MSNDDVSIYLNFFPIMIPPVTEWYGLRSSWSILSMPALVVASSEVSSVALRV